MINRTPRVLFYHGVDNIVNQEVEASSFAIDIFKKQINYLRKYYEIISLDELYKRCLKKTFTNREIVLTFDDGYANNLYTVVPILKQYDIPFSVFVSTEHIETGEYYPTSIARIIILGSSLKILSVPILKLYDLDISDIKIKREIYIFISKELKSRPLAEVRTIVEQLKNNLEESEYIELQNKYKSDRPMTWDEVIQLANMGVTIGSHCKYHMICHENQALSDMKEQIVDSKKIIEEKIKAECKYFAFPNGDYTLQSISYLYDAGYIWGFSTSKSQAIKNRTQTMVVPRIGVPLNFDTFKIVVNLFPKKNKI